MTKYIWSKKDLKQLDKALIDYIIKEEAKIAEKNQFPKLFKLARNRYKK